MFSTPLEFWVISLEKEPSGRGAILNKERWGWGGWCHNYKGKQVSENTCGDFKMDKVPSVPCPWVLVAMSQIFCNLQTQDGLGFHWLQLGYPQLSKLLELRVTDKIFSKEIDLLFCSQVMPHGRRFQTTSFQKYWPIFASINKRFPLSCLPINVSALPICLQKWFCLISDLFLKD